MWGGDMMGWGGGWSWLGIVPLALWWFLIILGVVVLAKWLFSGGASRTASGDRALAILRERYARGEIDKEEFELKKRDIAS